MKPKALRFEPNKFALFTFTLKLDRFDSVFIGYIKSISRWTDFNIGTATVIQLTLKLILPIKKNLLLKIWFLLKFIFGSLSENRRVFDIEERFAKYNLRLRTTDCTNVQMKITKQTNSKVLPIKDLIEFHVI